MRVVRANDLNEGILVKKWLPKAGVEPGSNKLLKSPGAPSGYSYVNIAKNELPEKEINGVWQYEWASAEVEDKAGIAGQNNENPASLFGDHVIAFVQEPGTNKYYDPCYGMTYESSADIEAKVIDFYTRNTNDVKEYFIRPNVLKIELNAKLVKY